jgi:hypothetical protein
MIDELYLENLRETCLRVVPKDIFRKRIMIGGVRTGKDAKSSAQEWIGRTEEDFAFFDRRECCAECTRRSSVECWKRESNKSIACRVS